MAEPLITVRHLHRVYRRPRTALMPRPANRPASGLLEAAPTVAALRGVSLDIGAGERFGLVGESGSGKSTLIRLLSGLDRPTSGTITFEGRPVGRRGLPRGRLGVVFQDPMGSLDPRMRVRDTIAEPLVGARAPRELRRVLVNELLEDVGLEPEAGGRYPHQFSGGQRQRISLARALSTRPSVLMADEPVSALDVSVRAQILNLIDDLVSGYGLTLVMVSHDLSVIRHSCDTVGVMRRGELLEVGPAERVAREPAHPYTRELVAAVPDLRKALGLSGGSMPSER